MNLLEDTKADFGVLLERFGQLSNKLFFRCPRTYEILEHFGVPPTPSARRVSADLSVLPNGEFRIVFTLHYQFEKSIHIADADLLLTLSEEFLGLDRDDW